MKAIWTLAVLPVRRMPVGCTLVILLYLAGLGATIAGQKPALVVICGVAVWLWTVLCGMTLHSVMRPESLLLPGIRRHLASAAGIHALFCVLVPVIAMTATGAWPHAALAAALLLLTMSLGLATGLGMRITLLVWLVFIVAGWVPHLADAVAHAVTGSPWSPLAVALLALLLLRFALRPLLTVSDRDPDASPMQAIADGRKPVTSSDGASMRRGLIAKKLTPMLDGTAQRALTSALGRFRRTRSAGARMAVIRAVLLPHDNPLAVIVNAAVVAVFVSLYVLFIRHDQHWDARYVGGYALIMGLSRFAAVGRGMLRLRPSLADLYMTLAPRTRSDFQATMADTLLWLIGVSMFNCLAYAVLIAVLLHAAHPAQLLLAVGVISIGGAFGALAVHLVGPESTGGRAAAHIALLAGTLVIYALTIWLMGRFGLLAGLAAAALLSVSFGIGAWRAARRDYLRRTPQFDAPL